MATKLTVVPTFPHVDSPRAGFDLDGALIGLMFVAQVVVGILAFAGALDVIEAPVILAAAQLVNGR